jgi:hypothetical protein
MLACKYQTRAEAGNANSTVFYQVYCALFYFENDAEILFPVHYKRKVAQKGFMMAFMMNKHCND